ncbi:MAG: ribulose-phosphate 3-epimerase [Bacilli bacterium]|nr:ribulose-phosphate 3-epimerase [Bacilli bacterium]
MISVSILNEKENYEQTINKINKTNVDYLHLDIMDKTFTINSSFSIDQAKEINKLNNKKLDIHLMSEDLDNILDEYIKLKPDIISIHFEAVDKIDKYIKKIKKNNIKVGIAINPDTLVSEIYQYLDQIDIVLVMGVKPGKSGQTYIEDTTKKLIQLKKMQPNYKYLIEVDGGINNKTINKVKDYANIIVSGSYITSSDNYQDNINILNQ